VTIKHQEVLSRADFDEAVVRLRLNVSDVAKATGIPRTYLSEFRHGDRKLRPEHLGKLKDFFEEKGIEFDGSAAPGEEVAAAAPHSSLAVTAVCYFPVRGDLDRASVRDVLTEIERNDARIKELFAKKARVVTGWNDEPKGFEDETDADLRELFCRLSGNYVLFRFVTGVKNLVDPPNDRDTLHGIVMDALRESLDRAGIESGDDETADLATDEEAAK